MDILKELLSKNNHALQTLHESLGFDFCKPFIVDKISGKFTVNQIIKRVNVSLPDPNKVIALYVNEDCGGWLNLVTIDHYGNITIDNKTPYYYTTKGSYNIITFWAKKRFEDIRKHEKVSVYIISQSKEYITTPIEKTIDYKTGRFDYVDNGFTCHGGKSYINRVTVKNRDTNGEKSTRVLIGQVFYTGMISHYKTDISQIIDKSGYFVDYKRDDLKRRAAALKADRQKAAFIASDHTDKITELETMILGRKKEIEKLFNAAVTSEDIKAVVEALNDYRHGLKWVLYSFELFKQRIVNKEYSNINNAVKAYQDIKIMLACEEV